MIFVLAESSRTILSIDRSKPRFKGRAGGKIRITLKNNKNFDVLIFGLIRFKIVPARSRKWKTGHLAFNLKKFTSTKRC